MNDKELKKCINDEINNKFYKLIEKINPIENIIAHSKYYCLAFAGVTSLSDLIILPNQFDLTVILQKRLMIKSIKSIVYANAPVIDKKDSLGVTEIVPTGLRLQRIPENFANSIRLEIKINGQTVNLFPFITSPLLSYIPLDIAVDNIFYIYKDKIETFEVASLGYVITDWEALNSDTFYHTILIECYSF